MAAKPIVIGVDESPASLRAVALARRLAAALGAPCRIVHAFPDLWPASAANELVAFDLKALNPLVQDIRRQLVGYFGDALPAPRDVEVWFGRAGWVLAQAAQRYDAQLVVVGGKHHNVLARTLGGSTAHHLVRTLDVPVLVAGPSRADVRRVLTAIDLSSASDRTLDVADRMAEAFGAELRVLHAVEPMPFPTVAGLGLDENIVVQQAEAKFEGLADRVADGPTHSRTLRYAEPADAIADEVRQWSADLVVVGSHGKGWVDRILIGSTTEQLLNHLPASLLVVPIGHPKHQEAAPPRVNTKKVRVGV